MLPRTKRLSRADFDALPRVGVLLHGKLFSLKVFPHTRLPSAGPQKAVLCEPSKIAVVISSKAMKRSVDRHVVKRRVMECLQNIPPGFSCVFYAKAPAVKATYKEIRAEISALLQKAHVLQ